MKFELDNPDKGSNKIDAYTVGQVTIANVVYKSNLLVAASSLVPDWSPQTITELNITHTQEIIKLDPEIVILGTGKHLNFPPDSISGPFIEQNIGFETMDTGAACRCYNLLLSEGRHVVAALFMIEN